MTSQRRLIFYYIVLRPKRKLRNVLTLRLLDNQYVVLPVSPGPRFPLGDGYHRLHGNHHIRLQDCVDILADFQSCLAAVIVAENTKGMPVTKRAVLQQVMLKEKLVQFFRYVATARARLYQFQSSAVNLAVDFPEFHVAVSCHVIKKQCAFEGRVVSEANKRKQDKWNQI